MKSMRWLWSFFAILALVATTIFIAGFMYASNEILYPQKPEAMSTIQPTSTPTPIPDKLNGIRIVAIGDSLTAGTGDISGTGYVGFVKQKLAEQTGEPVYILNNLAIPGSTTTDWMTQLTKKTTQDAIQEADLILLSIGGNDLFQGGLGILDEKNPERFDAKPLFERTPQALENLKGILANIHQLNPQATVMYVGLYHPFLNIDLEKSGYPAIQAWNSAVFELMQAYSQMYVVPTLDLFIREQDQFLAADHFHPNQDGYERIATRMVQILQ